MIWSMASDRRLPGHQLWSQVPRATGGPTFATLLAAVLDAVITLALRTNISALVTLFTILLYVPAFRSRVLRLRSALGQGLRSLFVRRA